MRSATSWIGGFDPCAACTELTMRPSVLLSPHAVTIISPLPSITMDPPKIVSPTFLLMSLLSPVNMDSSMPMEFVRRMPSDGADSPSTNRIMSPFCSSEASINMSPALLGPVTKSSTSDRIILSSSRPSSPDRTSLARVALRFVSLCIARAVCPLA